MLPPGPPVILPLGAVPLSWCISVWFTLFAISLGVPDGAEPVSPDGAEVALDTAVVEDVLAWVDEDPVEELVHPATKTIPIRKIPIARAIPRFRFRLGIFFDDGEIEFIRVLLLVQ